MRPSVPPLQQDPAVYLRHETVRRHWRLWRWLWRRRQTLHAAHHSTNVQVRFTRRSCYPAILRSFMLIFKYEYVIQLICRIFCNNTFIRDDATGYFARLLWRFARNLLSLYRANRSELNQSSAEMLYRCCVQLSVPYTVFLVIIKTISADYRLRNVGSRNCPYAFGAHQKLVSSNRKHIRTRLNA